MRIQVLIVFLMMGLVPLYIFSIIITNAYESKLVSQRVDELQSYGTMISNLVVLGMCFLAGVFVPLEYLSDTLVKAAHFLPVYWYVEAVRRIDAMAEDSMSAVNVLPDFGMQILFAVTLAAAGAAYARRCQKRI